VSASEFTAGPDAAGTTATNDIANAEGLILVANGSHGAARIQEQLSPWAASVSSSPAELKLLVTTHADRLSQAHQDDLHAALVLWALDHGFELIQADATNPVEGGDEREKEGLPRVWEAMQSVMWSSLQMHPPGGTAAGGGVASSAAGSTAAEVKQGDAPGPAQEANTSPAAASKPTAAAGTGEDVSCTTQAEVSLSDTQSPDGTSEIEDLKDGPEADEFEAMLAQVAAIREANQREGVTDEQRRQNAADMALKLLSAFGLGDSEEDLQGVLGGQE